MNTGIMEGLPSMADPIPSTMNMPYGAEQLKYLLDNNELSELIENYLRGRFLDASSNEYVQKFEPMANEEGIRNILCRVQHCHRAINFTKMPKENVQNIIIEFADNLAIDLTLYSQYWGIIDSHKTMIWEFITNVVFTSFCKSSEGTLMSFLRTVMRLGYQETTGSGYGNPYGNYGSSSSWYDKLNPFHRR